MRYLKQSTAIEVKVGPFLDSTDGNTQETALTISQADVRLAKNAADWAQKSETTTLVHEEAGWYRCLLDTTDTDTLGILVLAIHESGALPVWVEFHVLAANVYDSLVGSGDVLDVSTTQFNGSAVTQASGRPEVNTTHFGGSALTQAGGRPEVNTTQFNSSAVVQSGGRPEVNATHWLGTAAATPTTAGIPVIEWRGIRSATAQSGAGAAITLDVSASATSNIYVGSWICIVGGTGIGQTRLITAYDGASRTATVATWITNPDVTSIFLIVPAFAVNAVTGSVGSVVGLTAANLDATITSRASQASLDTLDDFVDTEVAAIKAKTDNLPSDPADASVIAAATAAIQVTVDAIEDAVALLAAELIVVGDAVYKDGHLHLDAHLLRDGAVDTSVSNCRAVIYNADGDLFETLTTEATSDDRGVFHFDVDLATELSPYTLYYALVTIEDALTGGTDRTGLVFLKRFQ